MSDIGAKAIRFKYYLLSSIQLYQKKLIWITRFPHSVTLRLRDIIGL